MTNFNPPTPWGVGPEEDRALAAVILISIHPPRGGWDTVLNSSTCILSNFNPPTPWGVGRLWISVIG